MKRKSLSSACQVLVFLISFVIYMYFHLINNNIVDQGNYQKLYEFVTSSSLQNSIGYGILTRVSLEPGLPIVYWLYSHLNLDKIFLMATLAGIFMTLIYRSLTLLGYSFFFSFCIVFLSYYPISTMIVNERLTMGLIVFFLANAYLLSSANAILWVSMSSIFFHWTLVINLYALIVFLLLKDYLSKLFFHLKIQKFHALFFLLSLPLLLFLFNYVILDKLSAYVGNASYADKVSSNSYFSISFFLLYSLVALTSKRPLIFIAIALPVFGLGFYMDWFGRLSPFLMGFYFVCLSPSMTRLDSVSRSSLVLIILVALVIYRLIPFSHAMISGSSYIIVP